MAERMRAARWRAGLSMSVVASETGVTINAVKAWEKGSIPEDATRAKLAALYGMEEPVLFAEYEAEVQRRLELLRPPA
jgi:transcriptional regulator with XRE-family HTH domain